VVGAEVADVVELVADLRELAPALLRLELVELDLRRRAPALAVREAGHLILAARDPGDAHGRDPGRRERIALEASRGELVRIRLQTLEAKAEAVADVEPLPVDTFRALGYELIGEDDDRNLILLGDVESEHGGV